MGQNYSGVYKCNVQQQLSYSETNHRDTIMNKTVIQYRNKTMTHVHDHVHLHGPGQETIIVVTVIVVIGVLCMVIVVAYMVSIKYKFGGEYISRGIWCKSKYNYYFAVVGKTSQNRLESAV